jgi:hypothetical protein
LLASPRLAVDPASTVSLVTRNGFPGRAVEYLDIADLRQGVSCYELSKSRFSSFWSLLVSPCGDGSGVNFQTSRRIQSGVEFDELRKGPEFHKAIMALRMAREMRTS